MHILSIPQKAVEFATGVWYGVELDDAVGKNNGTLKGKTYFKCADKHGMFARKTNIKLVAKGGAEKAKKVTPKKVVATKPKTAASPAKAAPATKAPVAASPPVAAAPRARTAVPKAALDAASATMESRNAAAARAAQAAGMEPANKVDPAVLDRLKDELEAATLDKQLAEIKLEDAQEDLIDMQAQVSALEAKAATNLAGGGGGGADATQLKHAIGAVVKFRDELIMKDEYISEMEGVLREERRACQKAEFALAQRTEQLDASVKKLGGMREQLDETSGSSGMVEDLSTKCSDLEDANSQMQGEIADLVSLISLNDTIIEEHRQAEMDALDALDGLERDYAQLGDAVKQIQSDNMRYKRAYHDIKREMEEMEELNPSAKAADDGVEISSLDANESTAGGGADGAARLRGARHRGGGAGAQLRCGPLLDGRHLPQVTAARARDQVPEPLPRHQPVHVVGE